IVAKFYRPGRWSEAAILEEHAFCAELVAAEVPVVAPLVLPGGSTLSAAYGFRFALFPKRGGRAPELDDDETLEWLGRFIARIHAIGARKLFEHRPAIDPASYGDAPLAALLASGLVPDTLLAAYEAAAHHALERVPRPFAEAGAVRRLRLHGDCHAGNILWSDGPHFVDFDDSRNGPAIQDLWMLLSGDRANMSRQLAAVAEGYSVFGELDRAELALIEPLRTL